MPCADLDELISAYVDGQTVPAQAEFLEAHLTRCARCQGMLRRQRQTARLLRMAGHDTWTPPDLRLRVAHAYRQRRPARRVALPAGLAGIAAALLVVFGILAGQALAPHSASPAATTPAAPVAATSGGAHQTLAQCRSLPRNQWADCLGVDQLMLRAVLADPHVVAQVTDFAISTIFPDGETSTALTPSAPKGGDTPGLSKQVHQGLQAL